MFSLSFVGGSKSAEGGANSLAYLDRRVRIRQRIWTGGGPNLGGFQIRWDTRSRHDFFYLQFASIYLIFHDGKALCRPVLCWFKQNWAYNANISEWRKFEGTICEIEPFEHSVVCSSHFSSWCCTDDSGPVRSKLFGSIKTTHTVNRRRGFGGANRTEKEVELFKS